MKIVFFVRFAVIYSDSVFTFVPYLDWRVFTAMNEYNDNNKSTGTTADESK